MVTLELTRQDTSTAASYHVKEQDPQTSVKSYPFSRRYPEGISAADDYLKGQETWGVLFGGVMYELFKRTHSHPENRKDIDVYAPYLESAKQATLRTGVDFWAGVPGFNLSRTIRLGWKIEMSSFLAARPAPGLHLLGIDSLCDILTIESRENELNRIKSDEEYITEKVLKDTGRQLTTICPRIHSFR